MAITNYLVAPEDGWTLTISDPDFLRVSTQPGYKWAYTIASSLPAASVLGVVMPCGELIINRSFTGNVYVRAIGPTTGCPAGKLRFDVTALSLTAAGTGTTAPQVQGNVAAGSADVGNPVKGGAKYNLTRPTYADGQRTDLQSDTKGNLGVNVVGGNNVNPAAVQAPSADNFSFQSNYGLVALALGYDWNGSNWDRRQKAVSTSRIVSAAATTNATSAKASAGTVHKIVAYNTTATIKYIKVYNKASAPTVGTDTPVLTLTIPALGSISESFPNGGQYFATGIAYALTGANGDADTTALAAGDVVGINVCYS